MLYVVHSKVGNSLELVSKSEEEAEVLSNQQDLVSHRHQEQKEMFFGQ